MSDKRSKSTVLIVDDELNNRNLLEMRLLSLGFGVETAANGLHALEKLQSNPDSYHIVVSDIKMPGLDGIELAKKMQEDAKLSQIPIIIMSGFPDKKFLDESKKCGVRDVLLKPFPFDELLKRLKLHLYS